MRTAKMTRPVMRFENFASTPNQTIKTNKHMEKEEENLFHVLGRAFLHFIRLCTNTAIAVVKTIEAVTGYQFIQLPWIKIGFLSILAIFFFKKDLQLELNLGSEKSVKTEKSKIELFDKHEERAKGVQASSFSFLAENPNKNPQAPISPSYLSEAQVKEYVSRFKDIAITEREKFGIPASISLAQGLIESRAGSSRLAKNNNNHFGMKCFSKKCKKGHCSNFHDDSHKDFFRKYKSAWESWREHSKMLISGRYKKLTNSNHYKDWAKGLASLGYATDPNYEKKLIYIIEQYQLNNFDR